MMKSFFKKAFLCMQLVMLSVTPAVSEEVDFSGSLETDFGLTLPYTEDAFKIVNASSTVNSALNVYGGNSSLKIDGALTFDAVNALYSENSLDYINAESSLIAFKLNEAYYDYSRNFWGFRIGRQIAQWGAADSFIVSNIICPQNLTVLSGTDVSETANGINAIKLNVNACWFNADFYWIPIFTPSTLPLKKSSILNELFIPSSIDLTDYGLSELAVNSFTSEDITLPELALKNGEYALRLNAYTGFADFSLYGYYGWEDTPCVSYAVNTAEQTEPYPGYGDVTVNVPESITLSGEYKRVFMIAFDSSIPLGQVTLRLEGAFFPYRYFSVSAENQLKQQFEQYEESGSIDPSGVKTIQQNHNLIALAGADWIKGDWTLSTQYYADFVFDGGETEASGDNSVDYLERDAFVHKTSFSISYSALAGSLDLSLNGIIGLNYFDTAIVPQVSYSLNDSIKLSLSAYIFNAGKEDGTYGLYKDLSCVILKGRFYF